jgi:ubiquinone/menaquinone biosynthesis C-methylase UbiE
MASRSVPSQEFLEGFYHDYVGWEPAFAAELEKSLQPRGFDLLFDLAASLGLPADAQVVDVGCGEGKHAFELARRFGWSVVGIDAVPWHVEEGRKRLAEELALAERVRFEVGLAEELPVGDRSVDLVWCRDMLVHVEQLEQAFNECFRVLRPGGRMLIYQQFATDRLEPREGAWLFQTMGVVPSTTNRVYFETAYTAAGFERLYQRELRSEWMEHRQEEDGSVGRELLQAGRLLRKRERFVKEFGQRAYDLMLGDRLWHIYQMIGKLSPRVYVLRKP